MKKGVMTYKYFAFGLNIQSDIAIPRLPKGDLNSNVPNVGIFLKDLKGLREKLPLNEWFCSFKKEQPFFHIENVASFFIPDSESIFIDPAIVFPGYPIYLLMDLKILSKGKIIKKWEKPKIIDEQEIKTLTLGPPPES